MHGVKPFKKDYKRHSYHRTFGSVLQKNIPEEFDFDAGFGDPDQNKPNDFWKIPPMPRGCTGMTQTQICQDEDGKRYNPKYTYDWGRYMDGHPNEDVGVAIDKSFKSIIVYGVKDEDDVTQADSQLNRRGRYFDAIEGSGMDAFDSIVSAMWSQYQMSERKHSVSLGTPWLYEWGGTKSDGLLADANYSQPYNSWHNMRISGRKVINGVPKLIVWTHQGEFGDKGRVYFDRTDINKLLAIPGSFALMTAIARPEDIVNIKLTYYQTVLSYLFLLLKKIV